jgi:hypothetical protein
MSPCKPFAIIRVFRLQLNKPIRLSVRLGHNYCPSGVDAGFVNLPVHLDHVEGVRNSVGGNRHTESNERSVEVSSVLALAKLASSKWSIQTTGVSRVIGTLR